MATFTSEICTSATFSSVMYVFPKAQASKST